MATYRQIKTTFWEDDYTLKLTPESKFFYLYLLLNSKTSNCGIYEFSIKLASFNLGYDEKTILLLLSNLELEGKIKYDMDTREIAIKNWKKHNDSLSPKSQAGIRRELSEIKSKTLLNYMGYENFDRTPAKKNYDISTITREEIFSRDGYQCTTCGSKEKLTIDHIYPRTLGGGNDLENLRVLCQSCNSKRTTIDGIELQEDINKCGYDYGYLKNKYQREF